MYACLYTVCAKIKVNVTCTLKKKKKKKYSGLDCSNFFFMQYKDK